MKRELVKALLEILDDNYGYSVEEGILVEYVGQGGYTIRVMDRDKLVVLASQEDV